MSHPAGNVLGFRWWLAIAIKVIGSLKLLGNLWNNSIAEGACQGIILMSCRQHSTHGTKHRTIRLDVPMLMNQSPNLVIVDCGA